jgi:PBP1b-binding outer membrane lipoprotein LpoB
LFQLLFIGFTALILTGCTGATPENRVPEKTKQDIEHTDSITSKTERNNYNRIDKSAEVTVLTNYCEINKNEEVAALTSHFVNKAL